MKTFFAGLMVLAMAGVTAAQGSDRETPNLLKFIGLAYHNHLSDHGKPPTKADDLKPYLESPKALSLLNDGKVVFIYKVHVTEMMDEGSSKTIVAYEKEAATKGGWCLFGDGSVRKLSAKEFGETKLAKPKKSG